MSGLFGGGPAPANLGPVVTGIQISTSAYGLPVPLVYGCQRVSPNIIWMPTGSPWWKKVAGQQGGKGGGGGGPDAYYQAVGLAFCEGPIGGFGRVWVDKDVYSSLSDSKFTALGSFTAFPGNRPESAWSFFGSPITTKKQLKVNVKGTNPTVHISDPLFSAVTSVSVTSKSGSKNKTVAYKFKASGTPGAGYFTVSGSTVTIGGVFGTTVHPVVIGFITAKSNAPYALPYGGTSYFITSSFSLGSSNAMKNISAEVYGFYCPGPGGDVSPADVLQHFLTDPTVGCGLPAGSVITDVGQDGTAASSYRTYCAAMNFTISWVVKDQKSAIDHVKEILEATNSDMFWSSDNGGCLKIVPLGDTPVGSYVPYVTPVFDIGPDDIIAKSPTEDRIVRTRISQNATFNSCPVEYLNRHAVAPWQPNTSYAYGDLVSNGSNAYECVMPGVSDSSGGPTGTEVSITDNAVTWSYQTSADINAYAVCVADFTDQADVNLTKSVRKQSPATLHCITNDAHALVISRLKTQRSLNVRSTYKLRLGWKHGILEPLDLITLSDDLLGLDHRQVRIRTIEEGGQNADGEITITAEDWLGGSAHAAAYVTEKGEGGGQTSTTHSTSANPPIIFAPPLFCTVNGKPEIWIGTSGATTDWGGCQVWLSWDDGSSYSYLGDTGACVYGVLGDDLGAGPSLDTASILTADVRQSDGVMLSVSAADRDAMLSTCLLDGEIIAYQTASLVGTNLYNLTQLRRGCQGTLPAPHSAGSLLVKLDGPFLRVPVDPSRFGTTVTVKLVSYNLSHSYVEDPTTVPVYDYPLPAPPASRPTGDLPVRFTFDSFNSNDWDLGTSPGVLTIQTGGLDGGNMLEVAGNLVAVHKTFIPFSSNKLYGLSAQWRQKQEPTNGQKNFQIGLVGVAGDGVTFVDMNGSPNMLTSQHTAGPYTASVASSWQQSNGYWQGQAATGTVGGTLAAPGKFHQNVRYLRLAVWLNDASGDGIQDLDSLELFDALVQQAAFTVGQAAQTFHQATAPSPPIPIGSLWFDTSNGNKPYYWNGTTWMAAQFGGGAIAPSSIDQTHIVPGAITAGTIAGNAIDATKLADGSVSAAKLVAGAVDATKLADGSVVAGKIAAGTIGTDELAANAVVAGKIAAASIDASKLAVDSLSAIAADLGTITAGKIAFVQGGYIKVTGLGFGPSSNYLEWYGPDPLPSNPDPAAKIAALTDVAAFYYQKTTGVMRAPLTWTAITPATGWSAMNSLAYSLDMFGYVRLRGGFWIGGSTPPSTAFNMPAGLRPSQTRYFTIGTNKSGNLLNLAEVGTDGWISFYNVGSYLNSTQFVDSICYLSEQ